MIQEIECYELKRIPCNDFVVKFEFEDLNGNKYLIQFKNDSIGPIDKPMIGTSYELTYFVWDEDSSAWSISKIVSSNIFRLMNTIFAEAVPMFLQERTWVKKLRFEGLVKDNEKEFITQRTKVYLRYLKNNPIAGYKTTSCTNCISISKG